MSPWRFLPPFAGAYLTETETRGVLDLSRHQPIPDEEELRVWTSPAGQVFYHSYDVHALAEKWEHFPHKRPDRKRRRAS